MLEEEIRKRAMGMTREEFLEKYKRVGLKDYYSELAERVRDLEHKNRKWWKFW